MSRFEVEVFLHRSIFLSVGQYHLLARVFLNRIISNLPTDNSSTCHSVRTGTEYQVLYTGIYTGIYVITYAPTLQINV